MIRVMVVSNKWWECDPILLALLSDEVRPPGSPWPSALQPMRKRPDPTNPAGKDHDPKPRAVFKYPSADVELWCLSDLMEHLPQRLQSSSEVKASLLAELISRNGSYDYVIALGTAGSPFDYASLNGSVVLGSKVFLHDGCPGGSNPDSKWEGPFDSVIDSRMDRSEFVRICDLDEGVLVARMLPVPIHPANPVRVLANFEYVALSSINVTNYADYLSKDRETLQSFAAANSTAAPMSLETTHGVIRAVSEAKYIFVSGITDRVGHFSEEVTPQAHAQNTAAAHNIGVALAWILPRL